MSKRRKWGNWSAPFEPWVVESWRKHSEAIGAAEVAAKVRENLINGPARIKAERTKKKGAKA